MNNNKTKLTINFIVEYFYPEIGGLEKSTERLAEELSLKGHKINVITKKSVENTSSKEFYKGFVIYRYTDDYISLGRELYYTADINIVFGVGHKKNKEIWHSIFFANKPTFIKIGTSGDILHKGIDREAFAGFDAILCQNASLCEEARNLNFTAIAVEQIKNGLNITEWDKNCLPKKEIRKKLKISNESFVLCAVGRFVQRKNFPLIIEGANLYYNRYKPKNFTLLLQGGAEGQHDSDEKLIFQLIEKYSKVFPIIVKKPTDSVSETLYASDLFITMGEKEGAPNIIIEALASSLPILASNISGHKMYVTENNGMLLDFNAESIANALNRFFSTPELIRNCSKNSRLISHDFDIKKTSDIYLELCYKYLERNQDNG